MSQFSDERDAADSPQNAQTFQTTQISQSSPTPAPQTPAPDAEEPDLEALSERFVEDFRAGRRPSVDEYAERFPEFAEEIRELFPALALLEKGGARETLSSLSQGASRQGFALTGLDRLKNYRIVREIGRGGMGVVYEAWDETLERVVALKVMKIFPGEEEQAIKRFQREAKTAARLHHTNIVPVFDSDVLDDKFFYVMQFVDGVNLEQFLRMKEAEASDSFDRGSNADSTVASSSTVDSFAETTALTPPNPPENSEKSSQPSGFFARRADAKRRRQEAVNPSAFGSRFPAASKPLLSVRIAESNYYQRVCDVVIQAAQGLDYAHRHDVVHRDIKPSNLVVDEDGVVWITDFGLAKSTTENDLTRQGQLVGTLRYLAPEALEGFFSPLSDVYSLGLTLYELLTFTPAFDETNYTRLLARVAEGRPQRPRKINPKIPLDLETIVLKAVEPTPEKRYASAGEFADDLQRFLDDRPIRARRVGPIERVLRWRKRNRLVANLLFSIFVLVAIIFAGISNRYVKARALVRAKEAESQRAQANLDLALAAFDDVFASLGDAAAINFNFLDDADSLGAPTDDPSIPEKDARVLENLLAFYDGFIEENEGNEPTLLLKSARARVRVGAIRKLLGRSRDSDAFPKAFELYRRALAFAADETERSQIALEKATVVRAAYEAAPLENRLAEFLPLCAESLDELAAIPDASPLADAARRTATHLRFERAILRLETPRVGGAENGSLGFFETAKRVVPSPETRAEIDADFRAAGERLEELRRSGAPQTPDYLFTSVKFNAFSAVWAATLGDREEALERLRQSDEFARTFATQYPNDSRSYLAIMMRCALKALVDADLFPDVETRRAELEAVENQALSTADALVAKFPNSPQYAAFRIVVFFHFAKREAIFGNLERADELLEKADELIVEFFKQRPNFNDFQFFGPIRAARAEFFVALGKLDEAEEYVAKMETALRRFEEKAAAAPDADSPSRQARRRELQTTLERLRRLLDEARAAEPAPSPDEAPEAVESATPGEAPETGESATPGEAPEAVESATLDETPETGEAATPDETPEAGEPATLDETPETGEAATPDETPETVEAASPESNAPETSPTLETFAL